MEIDFNYCQELYDLAAKSYDENDIRLALTIKYRINGAMRILFNQTHCRDTLKMLVLLFKLEANISLSILAALNEESMTLDLDPFDICLLD